MRFCVLVPRRCRDGHRLMVPIQVARCFHCLSTVVLQE